MALNVVTPAAWAEAAPRTASAAGVPELSAHEVDEHVSVLDPLLTAAGSGLDALEEALAGVLAPATAEADEATADVALPELETAFESVPGGANARILLDLPCVRAAYAHTLPGGGWSPVRENFGSRAYASGLGAEDGEASALLALFVAPEDDSLWVSAPESPTGAVFSVDAAPATLPPPSVARQAAEQGFTAGILWDVPAKGAVVSASAEARPVRLVASLERVDGTAAVRPGDDVAFRVAVGSFLDGAGLEDAVDARLADADLAVSINGAPVQPGSLVAGEAPGVYTVSHRVSEQDVALGAVEAALDVRATYEGILAVPGGAPLRSRAAVAASLAASAPLSSPHGVTYRFVWDAPTTDAAPVPQGLTAPRDRAVHWPGDTVVVMQPEVTSVALREGTWSFQGWTLDGEPVGASVPMGDEGLVFQGFWAFAPAPRHSVTYGFSGDAPAVAPPATVRAYAGDAVALPQLGPVPETRLTDRGVLKDGTWRFCGWTVDGDEPATTVSGDTALEGSWVWSVPARPVEAAVTLAGHEGVYDGQDHSVTVDGLLSGDVASYASLRHVSGPVPARARVSTEPPSRCDAGATSVSVAVSNQGFADDAEATALLVVHPRPVRIAVDDATWVAGEPEPAYTGSVEMARWGSAEQRGLLDRAHLGRVSFRRVVDTSLPGVYEGAIDARYVENPNYDVEVLPGTLTIVAPAARPRGERV